jgi:cell fate regulator YaaT (PSP1 superfamily)
MKVRARELVIAHKLEMKISDRFQVMDLKPTFYYTANDRVDFRMLIRFCKEFSTRVEMKQVGFRQEAARLAELDLVVVNYGYLVN